MTQWSRIERYLMSWPTGKEGTLETAPAGAMGKLRKKYRGGFAGKRFI
jgi:hypothetical protein